MRVSDDLLSLILTETTSKTGRGKSFSHGPSWGQLSGLPASWSASQKEKPITFTFTFNRTFTFTFNQTFTFNWTFTLNPTWGGCREPDIYFQLDLYLYLYRARPSTVATVLLPVDIRIVMPVGIRILMPMGIRILMSMCIR